MTSWKWRHVYALISLQLGSSEIHDRIFPVNLTSSLNVGIRFNSTQHVTTSKCCTVDISWSPQTMMDSHHQRRCLPPSTQVFKSSNIKIPWFYFDNENFREFVRQKGGIVHFRNGNWYWDRAINNESSWLSGVKRAQAYTSFSERELAIMLSPVRLSSVCNVRAPYPRSRLKFSAIFLRHLLPWPSIDIHGKIFTEIVTGNTFVGGG